MAYGYPGDATPDANSLAGVGDRDNQLSASADHQSAALTLEGRYQRFGVWGKSTGQAFVENGKTYYDDDTVPTEFTYNGEQRHNTAALVDVYDPKHPPDKFTLRFGYEHRHDDWIKSPDWLVATEQETQAIEAANKDLYGAEEVVEEAARKKAEEPYSAKIFAPKYLTENFRNRYKEASTDGQDPYKNFSDSDLYAALKKKYPNPLDLYKEANPAYKEVKNDDLAKAIKDKYFPDMSLDEFNDRFNPIQNPVTNFFHKITEQAPRIIPGFFDSLKNLASTPQDAYNLFDRVMQALGMKEEQRKQLAPVLPALLAATVGAGAAIPDQQTAKGMFNFGQSLAARGQQYVQQHPIAPPQGLTGQVASKLFGGLGHAPEIALSFTPGAPAKAALFIGMTYDGIQGFGKAHEKGVDNDLLFGAEGLSYRALLEFFLRTVRGRMLSGLVWGIGGATDQAAQDFLAGKPSSVSDYVSTAILNAGLGAWLSTGKVKDPAILVDVLKERERGNYQGAAHLVDRAMLTMGDTERKAAANNFLAWRNEALEAGPGDNPLEMPGQRGFVVLQAPIAPAYEAKLQLGYPTPKRVSAGALWEPSPSREAPAIVPRETSVFPSEPRIDPLAPAPSAAKANEAFLAEQEAFAPKVAGPIRIDVPARQKLSPEVRALQPPAGLEKLDYLHRNAYNELVRRGMSREQAFEGVSRSSSTSFQDIINDASKGPKRPVDEITDQFYYAGIDTDKLWKDLIKFGETLGKTPFGRALHAIGRERESQAAPSGTQFELDPNVPVTPAVRVGGKVFPSWSHGSAHEKAGSPSTRYEIGYTDRKGKWLGVEEGAKIEQDYLGRDRPKGEQFYYSGIDPRKAWKEFKKLGTRIRESELGEAALGIPKASRTWASDLIVPEHGRIEPEVREPREAAAAIIGTEIQQMQLRNQQEAQIFYRQQEFEDRFKWAYEADQRRAFWDNQKGQLYDDSKLRKWFELHGNGLSTGNPVADRMFALGDKFLRALYNWDQNHRFIYPLKDSYIPHILANREDFPRLENEIRRRMWGDPDFMHPQKIPNIEMLHILGFKLKTYNWEDYLQIRAEMSFLAEAKAKILEDLRAAHLAFTADDILQEKAKALENWRAAGIHPPKHWEERIDNFWDKQKEQTKPWRTPRSNKEYKLNPDGTLERDDPHEIFFVHREASFMLHRAFDPVEWWNGVEPFVKFAQRSKQKLTGLNLGWSGYHQLHMLPIGAAQIQTLVMRKFLEGTGDIRDLSLALTDTMTLGTYSHIRALYHNQRILNWFQTGDRKLLAEMSPRERELINLFKEGGFIPAVSHERALQIERWLASKRALETLQARPINFALSLGHAIIGARPYQRWLFGRVIPSLQQYHWEKAADALKAAHPELWKPQNWLKRRMALRKITQDVYAHFGERNLRQSFEDPHIKALGQGVLLSYTWNTSMLDTYGGAIHDIDALTRNEFKEAVRKEGFKRSTWERFLTNKLLYGMNLQVMSGVTSLAIATLAGVGFKTLGDLIFPNVGPDPDDPTRLKRVKPPFWLSTDIFGIMKDMAMEGAFWPGAMLFATNKFQSGIGMFYDIWLRGKDYFGNDITAPGTPAWEAFEERIKASIMELAPFILQNAFQPGMTPKDVVLSMIGLNPASKYWERTPGEQAVMEIYTQYHTTKATEAYVHAQHMAREQYREGLLRNDPQQTKEALERMRQAGMEPKAIKTLIENVHKNPHASMEEHIFKHSLDSNEQARVLHKMKGDELKHYWHLARPEARKKYHETESNWGVKPGMPDLRIPGLDDLPDILEEQLQGH